MHRRYGAGLAARGFAIFPRIFVILTIFRSLSLRSRRISRLSESRFSYRVTSWNRSHNAFVNPVNKSLWTRSVFTCGRSYLLPSNRR
jgi:hypothetical protein